MLRIGIMGSKGLYGPQAALDIRTGVELAFPVVCPVIVVLPVRPPVVADPTIKRFAPPILVAVKSDVALVHVIEGGR
jgi:hypothetical protein